jgi:hypothetical protein
LYFWFTKILWHFSVWIAIALFIAVFFYAYYKDIVRPKVGAEAPFAQETLQAVQNDTLPRMRALPLSEPHRTHGELQRWISQAIAEVMFLEGTKYDQQLEKSKSYFTEAGYTQFKSYLDEAGLREALLAGNLNASIFVERNPLLMNDGSVGGTYHWLFEVPVTITYVPATNYSYDDKKTPETRRILIRAQIGRVADPTDENAIRIETWTVSPGRS